MATVIVQQQAQAQAIVAKLAQLAKQASEKPSKVQAATRSLRDERRLTQQKLNRTATV
jgi:hypothetical protein